MTEVIDFYLDLARAAATEHADYMFPLMRATNDCMLFGKYGRLLNNPECPADLLDFVLRTRQAQLYEALQSFVLNIIPAAGHQAKPIFTYFQNNPELLKEFNQIRLYAENTEMMNAFNKVRNNLAFHYDVRESHCRKTLKALSVVAKAQPSIAQDNPMVRSAEFNTRFYCADLMTSVSWSISHGQYDEASFRITEPITIMTDNDYHRKYADFSGEAMSAFFRFGNTTSLLWLKYNHLATDIKTHNA